MRTRPSVKGVDHVGIAAQNPEALANFYHEVLGLAIVGLGRMNGEGVRTSVFLGRQAGTAAHQMTIYADPAMRHTAFRVATLAALRALYQLIIARAIPVRWVLNHGVSLAFYFSDPASNLIKLYWPTGIAYPQPHGHPIDLSQSETALMQDVANLMAQFKLSKEGNSGLA